MYNEGSITITMSPSIETRNTANDVTNGNTNLKEPSHDKNGTSQVNESTNGKGNAEMELSMPIEELTLRSLRVLFAELVQSYKGGHPGTPMGAAAIGVALWKHVMRFSSSNPLWHNRDRFVLSAGHACLLQYVFLHLVGYKAWTLDMIRRYHSKDFVGSLAAGHPEIEPDAGIEVTTGPLGQGIANAVGMAMAAKHLGATFNKPDYPIVDNTIWCFTGDGCIQEGIGQEALSVAGHLGLDNLVVIYDQNNVTVDGNIDICFTEDTNAKLLAQGWHVMEIQDGSDNIDLIAKTLTNARSIDKPVFINIKTTIGVGSKVQGTGPAHGAPLGQEDVDNLRSQVYTEHAPKFHIPGKVYEYFEDVESNGAQVEKTWKELYASWAAKYPDLAAEYDRRMSGQLPTNWKSLIPSQMPEKPMPTRQSSGVIVKALAPHIPQVMAGSADLAGSTFVTWPEMKDFQKGQWDGRQIRYGIREHSMAAIANGLVAYQKEAILPIISTFFMFFLYAAPAIRMSALQKLRVIGIATHDSIGIGEDGPTHQPIALASLFRAMPDINFLRPADAEEVAGCWILAIESHIPSILALSRHAVPLLPGSDRTKVALGAYPIFENGSTTPQVILIATGAEVARAVAVAEKLPISTRVVSMPSMAHFDAQPKSYREQVLPKDSLIVAIEAYASFGWARYAHASISMHSFGLSGPQAELYEHFGFGVEHMSNVITGWVDRHRGHDGHVVTPQVGDFEELNLSHVQSTLHA